MFEGWGRRFGGRRGHGAGRKGDHAAACDGDCAACAARTLCDVAPGGRCAIRRLKGCGPTRQRLLDLGFQPGREIRVLRSAPLLDPIEVQVGDCFVALRRCEARHVHVEAESV
ncbi:MAG: ferrous iron transport protein A [Rubrimonas sp.]|uniref:FeoA family protein n=1 Tax=Rubrimonas sp. TaxID=2036015 RepID=UPI002FDE46FB